MDIPKIQSFIKLIEQSNTNVVITIADVIESLKEKNFFIGYMNLDIIAKESKMIQKYANEFKKVISNVESLRSHVDNLMKQGFNIEEKIKELKIEVEKSKKEIDLNGYCNTDKLTLNLNKVITYSETISNTLKYTIESTEEELKEVIKEHVHTLSEKETFNVATLTRYYFIDEDEFAETWNDGEYIVKNINDTGNMNYKEYSLKLGKNKTIIAMKSEQNVKIEVEKGYASVKINDKREYLDLKYKFEVETLETNVKISTVIKEQFSSVLCVLYVDYSQANNFINALNVVKEIQIINKIS